MKQESLDCVGFRLVGEVAGENRVFPLLEGRNLVGSAAEGVRLKVRGVSRSHAVLWVRDGAVELEDLDSKNGSFVGDQKVDRHPIMPGDALRFGPVRLHLETAHPEDGRLALGLPVELSEDLSLSAAREGSALREETSLLGGASAGAEGMAFIPRLLEHLEVLPEPDLAGALNWVAAATGAAAGAFVEWQSTASPTVLAAAGTVGVLPTLRLLGAASSRSFDVHRWEEEGVTAVLVRRGRDLGTGLLFWGSDGSLAPPRDFLKTALRLFLLVRRGRPAESPEASPVPSAVDLDFPDGIVAGASPAMVSLYQQMKLVARGATSVLLLGETGVGKEHLARTLHRSSDRNGGPFVAVNCSAIPAELLEAEMFGVEKGVATGVRARTGKFLEAAGGTLFLDEIGEMPASLQAKLLRVLQEKVVEPLGGRPQEVDIRIVSATNCTVDALIDSVAFRRDLYFRLAGFVLEVPPLRQRSADIPTLVGHFLQRTCEETGTSVRGLTVRALRALQGYPWPGNVRELEHEVRRLVLLCPRGGVLDSSALSPRILEAPSEEPATDADAALEEQIRALENRCIRDALRRTAGNQSQAARLLGVSRNGLAKRMRRLQISADEFDPLRD